MASFFEKAALYGEELAFVARSAPGGVNKLALVRETLAFHVRNALGSSPDPSQRMTFDIEVADKPISVTLRPRDGDIAIFYEIFARDAYKISAAELPPASVRTIIDAGANIGFSALYLATRYPAARIVCVEPNPGNFALLQINIAHEPRIEAVCAAVTPRSGETIFIDTAGRGSHFQTNRENRGVAVPAMTINEICASFRMPKVDLLKMDIEGAESAMFAAADFLDRIGAIVAELHGGYGLKEFNRDLAGSGLTAQASPHARDPNLFVALRST